MNIRNFLRVRLVSTEGAWEKNIITPTHLKKMGMIDADDIEIILTAYKKYAPSTPCLGYLVTQNAAAGVILLESSKEGKRHYMIMPRDNYVILQDEAGK